MSIVSAIKKLFQSEPAKPAGYPPEQHKEFTIVACPQAAGGQYRVAATISKTIDGEVKQHDFIRSDTCAVADDAAELAVRKCITFIDQMGDRIFD